MTTTTTTSTPFITEDDRIENLHQQCRDLMEKLNSKYGWDNHMSLCEYYDDFYFELTQDERTEILTLLEEF